MPLGPRWRAGLVGAAALLGYGALAPAVPGLGDGGELTLALAFLTPGHPSGYPLYVIVGHAVGAALTGAGASWPWAANVFSALGGAAAVAGLWALTRRLVPELASTLLVVALLGLNLAWLEVVMTAEVYSWHVAWVCAAALAYLHAWDALGSATERRAAAIFGVLAGAGLAHHLTSVLLIAPAALALAWRAWSLRGWAGVRLLALGGLAAAAPLSAYGLVLWRAQAPAPWHWGMLSPGDFWGYVLARPYQGLVGQGFTPDVAEAAVLNRWVFPLLALVALGVGRGLGRARSLGLTPLVVAVGLGALFPFGYGTPDPSAYFLGPVALGLPLALAVGTTAAERGARVARVGALVGAALFMAPAIPRALAARAELEALEARLRGMWASLTVEAPVVVWASDLHARLVGYQLLEHERPDVEVVNPFLLAYPGPRARFVGTHGFDPFDGLALPGGRLSPVELDATAARVASAINARSPRPVVLFDLDQASVKLLRKDPEGRGGRPKN